MKGEISIMDYTLVEDMEFRIDASSYDFCLEIYVDDNKTFEKQLKNKEEFKRCMNGIREFREHYDEPNPEEDKKIDYIDENFDNLLDSVEFIKISFDEKDPKEYIMNNPSLLEKKVVINKELVITEYDELLKLMKKYKGLEDKIYIRLEDNSDYLSLNECFNIMNAIKEKVEYIKGLNLSPMETIMYVYDQVRNRVYTEEDKDEMYFKARDLKEVMTGDKIVCTGYANMFHTILTQLGYENSIVNLALTTEDKGHARNVVYVKDDKYKIDGVYYFDATHDSKIKEDDNSYLYNYRYFAKTRLQMDELDDGIFIDQDFPYYSANMYGELEKLLKYRKNNNIIEYANSINYMSKMIIGEILIKKMEFLDISPEYGKYDEDKILRSFKKVASKFNKEIPGETMINILNNVRREECYEDPAWYPYDKTAIAKTAYITGWELTGKHYTAEELLLSSIFGKVLDVPDSITNLKNYVKELNTSKK